MLPLPALDVAHIMDDGSDNPFVQPRTQQGQSNSSTSTFSSIAAAARVVPPPAHTYSPSLRGRTRLPPAEPRPSSSNSRSHSRSHSRSRSRSRSRSTSSSSSLPVSNRQPSTEQAPAYTAIGSGVLQQAQARALTELKQGSQQGDSQQEPEAAKELEEAELYPRINAWSDLEKCNELVYNQDLKQDQINRRRHTRSSSIERFFDGTARLLGISGSSSHHARDLPNLDTSLRGRLRQKKKEQQYSNRTRSTSKTSVTAIGVGTGKNDSCHSLSTILKSNPIRLLAFAVIFFNILIVVRVMAEQLHIGSISGNAAVPIDNALGKKYPVIMATSHNDEMQSAPFTEAMSLGIGNIEVDVWLQNGTLLAGHKIEDISPSWTLKKMYLDPLYKMLERANADSATSDEDDEEQKDETSKDEDESKGQNQEVRLGDIGGKFSSASVQKRKKANWNGVWPLAPEKELVLMLDVKNDPEESFYAALDLLQPFIAKDWLTVYRDGQLVQGPLTIVGTGDTPISLVYHSSPRYIFYDAPLINIGKPFTFADSVTGSDTTIERWSPEIAPIASSKWIWWNYYPNEEALKVYSDEARKLGIKSRWWGAARWPAYFRRAIWRMQYRAGVDWFNADDLADVASFLRNLEEEKAKQREGRA